MRLSLCIKGIRLIATMALVIAASRSYSLANLVTNGGFETGNFSGWTAVPGGSGSDFGVFSSGLQHSGTFFAFFQNSEVGQFDAISQTFGTTAGLVYKLDFFLGNHPPPVQIPSAPAEFQVYWNGGLILDLKDVNFFSYLERSFFLPATGSTTELKFAGYNIPSFFQLDDVVVDAAVTAREPSSFALLLIGLALFAGFTLLSRSAL